MLICGVQINFSLVLLRSVFLNFFFYFDEVLMSLLVSFFFNKIMNFHFDIFFSICSENVFLECECSVYFLLFRLL